LHKTIVIHSGHSSSGAWSADNLTLGENQWTPLIMNASWRPDKWAILPSKKPGSDTTPGNGENARPLVILAYRVYTSLLHGIWLMKELVGRDLSANIQCAGASVVPLAAFLINVG
jgi:hypothetical protein